jgi:RimJ/RimL family protein N-acetyltransferase
LHQWQNDLELLDLNASHPASQSLHHTEAQLIRWMRGDPTCIRFAIDSKETNTLLGFAQLALIDEIDRNCKIGITIGPAEHRGIGLGRELLHALLDYAFATLQLHRVAAEVYSHNERALRLFRGFGFVEEGRLRQVTLRNAQWVDEVAFGLLQTEWS